MMKPAVALVALVACGGGASKTVYFELGKTAQPGAFFDYPWPSDLRLDDGGAPDVSSYPNPRNGPLLANLLSVVPERRGWPTMSVAYFRFTAELPSYTLDQVMTGGPAYLVDIDPASPELGTAYPVVADSLPTDIYVPSDLVAIAPRPGIVLRPDTEYAYVLARDFAPGFAAPSGLGDAVFDDLWPALPMIGLARSDVLAATVFTTGDEIARTRARSEAIRAAFHPAITNLVLDGGATYDGFCRLDGQIAMPQFQTGTQPFDTGGLFVLDGNDVPMQQGSMTIPLVITLPKEAMPASGWPLYQFFHGSGGVSSGLVDLGPSPTSADMPIPGEGPGYVVALHHIAAASSALPLNPERLPGASDYEYLNINNLAAFPQTFQQGVFEQRLLTDALLALQIPQSLVADCTGISTPDPGGNHFFDPQKLVAGGQSMGGMYTNMVGAVEPRFGALVPTGAGGFWNYMILESTIVPGARSLLAAALGIDDSNLVFMHPAMNGIALAWEIAEPIVYMNRLGRRPLPGMPVHHVYEPVGMGDSYFPTDVYDAAALSYGNQEATPAIWPTMQTALALEQLAGLVPYPVEANQDGKTRVVVQFMGDGIIDPHYIYRQLDSVKHQYGCFLESFLRDGVPTVPDVGGLTDPCP
ncbi:MAG TPA: hypothetical protein VLX92_15425 [Kofleriaceae bacterium]|nr:hypothetical protein [Kofleriaceae bacterium]